MEIVSLGETVIDFRGTGGLSFQGFVGGSPLNVAVAAARLGGAAALATQLSTDMFGKRIAEHMRDNGLDDSLVLRSEAPTTLAFMSERGGEVEFTFHANGSADALYDPRPRPTLPTSVRFLEFGSISLLRDPSATAILEIVAAHRKRCLLVFDPNVRPALIGDRISYLSALDGWLELPQLVKVSMQDLAWLRPGKAPREVARAWLARGPQAVIVTMGERGSGLYLADGRQLTVRAPQVAVADSVGAGDTFTGALMVALREETAVVMPEAPLTELSALSDEQWRRVLAFAASAAALNCTRPGADPPRRPELAALLAHEAANERTGPPED